MDFFFFFRLERNSTCRPYSFLSYAIIWKNNNFLNFSGTFLHKIKIHLGCMRQIHEFLILFSISIEFVCFMRELHLAFSMVCSLPFSSLHKSKIDYTHEQSAMLQHSVVILVLNLSLSFSLSLYARIFLPFSALLVFVFSSRFPSSLPVVSFTVHALVSDALTYTLAHAHATKKGKKNDTHAHTWLDRQNRSIGQT